VARLEAKLWVWQAGGIVKKFGGATLRRFAAAGVIAAGSLATSVSVAPAASAHEYTPSSTVCSAGYLCFWADADYSNSKGSVQGTNDRWSTLPFSGGNCSQGNWNDCASSIYNRKSSQAAYVYQDTYRSGGRLTINPGVAYAHLGSRTFSNGVVAGDNISSNSFS
jgi:hypothetical protein